MSCRYAPSTTASPRPYFSFTFQPWLAVPFCALALGPLALAVVRYIVSHIGIATWQMNQTPAPRSHAGLHVLQLYRNRACSLLFLAQSERPEQVRCSARPWSVEAHLLAPLACFIPHPSCTSRWRSTYDCPRGRGVVGARAGPGTRVVRRFLRLLVQGEHDVLQPVGQPARRGGSRRPPRCAS